MQEVKSPPPAKRNRSTKDILIIFIIVGSGLYLINPTAGIFEFIPDNIPLIGNLDEGVATTALLWGLSYFGYNFTNFFKHKNK